MKTTEERMRFYKKMLHDYRVSDDSTHRGFCIYLQENGENYEGLSDFPELEAQKPKKLYALDNWFKPGRLLPRIKCIQKAIELCELNIKQDASKRN
jgi:hypothetical protein